VKSKIKFHDEKLKRLQQEAQDLIWRAERFGFVIRIDTVSEQPLSMGNVTMVPDIRPARGNY